MGASTTVDSAVSNPGGTGNTLVITLPSTQAVNDVLFIWITNTGNAAWGTSPNWGLNQSGWSRKAQFSVGTSSNGVVCTLLYRKLVSGDTLPLTNPTATLGATSTRSAVSWTERGADIEGVFVLPEWGDYIQAVGTANLIDLPDVTTHSPQMHVIHCYGQRAATNAPQPTGYTQLTNGEVVISGTLVNNVSEKTVADAQTLLADQTVTPTSGARWGAVLICIPSPDYVYYRSGSQALTASGTSVTGTLPSGTASSDWRSNKDLVIATVEAGGTPTISPQVGGDWTEITGFATTTSGNGTTVRKYWALYDGTLNLQFNRSTTGEIAVCLTTYRNSDQTNPIGNVNVRQNASSTTSTWNALTRSETNATVSATCVADGTPSYTSPITWTERMDGNGIACSDQVFATAGSTASASFTLSAANATAVGLVELLSVSGSAPPAPDLIPRRGSFGQDARLRR